MILTPGLIVVLVGASLALVLFIANIAIAAKYGNVDMRVTVAVHTVGIVTILVNLARIISTAVGTVTAANVVALICIIISLRRNISCKTDQLN